MLRTGLHGRRLFGVSSDASVYGAAQSLVVSLLQPPIGRFPTRTIRDTASGKL